MNLDETKTILGQLKAAYPNQFRYSTDELKNILNFWNKSLSAYTFEKCNKAVNKYLQQNKTEFAPTLNQILELIISDSKYQNNTHTCDICNNTGMLVYQKNINYGGKVGELYLDYACRCSCNANCESGIPTYQDLFNFQPTKQESNKNDVDYKEVIYGQKK